MPELPCHEGPHPWALFSLFARSPLAADAVAHPSNNHLRSIINGQMVLDIGHVKSPEMSDALASLGREGDVLIDSPKICRRQAYFDLDPDTDAVRLCDTSTYRTTQVSGNKCVPFSDDLRGILRQITVSPRVNTLIGMGGHRQNLCVFELVWYYTTELDIKNFLRERARTKLMDKPSAAQTQHELPPTQPHTGVLTRIHAGPKQPPMKYKYIARLGAGTFGDVHK
ncbi:hypothetical protein HRG_014734 [Hirsutella rhossiliensis]